MQAAATDKDIVVLCSDSRGSASLKPFADAFPDQFVEVGIAEQNLVSVAAGMARCGKKAFAVSPACFLSTRSYEQAKVDCAYSGCNVKLIGISGGVSYGALGMTHHSAQDIAAMSALPHMRVYLPSDRFQTAALINALLKDDQPAYIRVGRNPVEDVYTESDCPFELNRMQIIGDGREALIFACGEMVRQALDAAEILKAEGIGVSVADVHSLKPLDEAAIVSAVGRYAHLISVEEHAPYGGLGARISQVLCAHAPARLVSLALPDAPVVSGNSREVFAHYGLDGAGIAQMVRELR